MPSSAENYTFPYPSDFRNPGTAWDVGAKILYLLAFSTFWCMICLLYLKRASIHRFFGRLVVGSNSKGKNEADEDSDDDVEEWSMGPQPAYPADKRILELFADQVRENPGSTALIHAPLTTGRREISYAELDALIEELAAGLDMLGISRGHVVALILPRSVAQVVAIWGVLKSGAAFLPIDDEAPDARKELVIKESAAPAVVAELGDSNSAALAFRLGTSFIALPTDGRKAAMEIKPSAQTAPGYVTRQRPEANDMALLIYTSGTTGTPKGIVYDHQHLMHGSWFFGDHCEINANSKAFLKSSYFWAVIEWEIFPALQRGGQLVIASPQGHKSVDYIAQVIKEEGINVLMITPQVWDIVLDVHDAQKSPLKSLCHVVTVGEPLPTATANRTMQARGLKTHLHNFYGASESSCTVYSVPMEGIDVDVFPNKAPAGLPQPHAKSYIMRADPSSDCGLRLADPGDDGEICFGGVLAAGYYRRDELTREKFVDTKLYGRLYRTGDLGRWNHGVLEVIGRLDRQVKIRGVRVEPSEIEVVLKRFGGTESDVGGVLGDASVVASPEPAELVAFVSTRGKHSSKSVTPEALKKHCAASLMPAYVPKFIIVLPDGLPRLPNGKPNLAELKSRAADLVEEQGETVLDSLGRMRKMTRGALQESAVVSRCYTYWMLGVMLDHYDQCGQQNIGYCTVLTSPTVQPWSELIIQSVGGYEDMVGFVLAGAFQDSQERSADGTPKVGLAFKDLYLFIVYMLMASPIPQVLYAIFGNLAVAPALDSDGAPHSVWGLEYMIDSSGHRWYLLMIVKARLFMALCEKLKVPAKPQILLMLIPSVMAGLSLLFPNAFGFWGKGLDLCQPSMNDALRYILVWVFGNRECSVFVGYEQQFLLYYIIGFHYLRRAIVAVKRYLPNDPIWPIMAIAVSMSIGTTQQMLNGSSPDSILFKMALVTRQVVMIIQPALFAWGMTQLKCNMDWWGKTTLGSYVLHAYFTDRIIRFFQQLATWLAWDVTGLLLPLIIIAYAFCVMTILGPIGNILLTLPQRCVRLHEKLRRKCAEAKSQSYESDSSASESSGDWSTDAEDPEPGRGERRAADTELNGRATLLPSQSWNDESSSDDDPSQPQLAKQMLKYKPERHNSGALAWTA